MEHSRMLDDHYFLENIEKNSLPPSYMSQIELSGKMDESSLCVTRRTSGQ